MKKWHFGLVTAAITLLLSTAVLAAPGDILGTVYKGGNIKAYVNGQLVTSYNIGGKTAIILEDLCAIGADTFYNDSLRTLIFISDKLQADENVNIYRNDTIRKYYETDIVTYVNGKIAEGYSFNGCMAVVIEDIADDNAYSEYGAKYIWNPQERTISLEFVTDNLSRLADKAAERKLQISIDNDTIHLTDNSFAKGSYGMIYDSQEFLENPGVKDVFIQYKDRKIPIGKTLFFRHMQFTRWDEEPVSLEYFGNTYLTQVDEERFLEFINSIEIPETTYEEVLAHFTSGANWIDVVERIDTEDCTFLHLMQPSMHGAYNFLVRIAKDGTYRDYSEDFESVSLYGTKRFDNLTIHEDTETVTFRYDTNYVIDLKTGEMTKEE